ncbi:MAG: VTC domain-containing protein [Anaerolineae bacterium]|nr:VTC domain-containing protein [Anaerolineae bacterium]
MALGTYETKYIFIAHQKNMILDWLEYCCIRDPQFYFGSISSIYYDTPGLHLYEEKLNSDYVKSKIRLRWYGDLKDLAPDAKVKCFLEVKRKYGSVRQKERLDLVLPSEKLSNNPFFDEDILNMPSRACDLMSLTEKTLIPMLLIQYERYRFVDPQSGSRLALDTNIRCLQANGEYIPISTPVYLGAGVFEVKGTHQALPASLQPISNYLKKEAFSKYGQCFDFLMNPSRRQI